MVDIKKGSPWVFWPSSICDTFPENPGNKILSGDQYFHLTFRLTLTDNSEDQKTLFAIVPRFTGLDVYKDKMILTVTCEDGPLYIDLPLLVKYQEEIIISLEHSPKEFFRLFINNKVIHEVDLKEKIFGLSESPHILIGAGNFPKNDFNLNYTDYSLHEFTLKDNKGVISYHKFEEFIFDKSVDLTGNLNFIHKL
jgi:hypothetical protein